MFNQAPVAHAAFGASPPFVNNSILLRGSRYVQTIYLVQDKADGDLPVKTVIDLPQAVRSWVSIDPGETFVIPKGIRQFPVQIVVQVPTDANLAAYSGTLDFQTDPEQSGQVTIALGVRINLNITVGTDIFRKLTVGVIRPLDIEEGWNPRVYVKANNEGNIAEEFDRGTVEVFDQFGSIRLGFAQKNREFPSIPPFTVNEFVAEFPIDLHLAVGQYWANILLYQGGKVIGSQRTVFSVLPRGSLSTPLEQFWYYLGTYWKIAIGGVLLFAALMTVFYLGRRSRRK